MFEKDLCGMKDGHKTVTEISERFLVVYLGGLDTSDGFASYQYS